MGIKGKIKPKIACFQESKDRKRTISVYKQFSVIITDIFDNIMQKLVIYRGNQLVICSYLTIFDTD